MSDEMFDFEGETVCVHETRDPRGDRKAILCRLEDGREVWVPYFAVHEDSEVYAKGHKGKLIVLARWAEEKKYL